jgi:hypothetical protein
MFGECLIRGIKDRIRIHQRRVTTKKRRELKLLLKAMKGSVIGQCVCLGLIGVPQRLTHTATTDDEAIGPRFVAGKRPQTFFALMRS